MNTNGVTELVKYTKVMVLLEVHRLSKGDEPIKPEILLTRAGLNAREIGELLGKNSATVAKAIQRAGKGKE